MRERFDEEIWPHAETVLRLAKLLTHRHADAEDLAQETLMRAYRGLARFDGRNPRAWLLTILRNVRVDHLRARRDVPSSELTDEVAAPELEGEVQWSDPAALLERLSDEVMIAALLELPEDIRWALLLVEVEGLDGATAGEVMGVPEGTVKSRLHRGRAMLRKAMAALGEAGSS